NLHPRQDGPPGFDHVSLQASDHGSYFRIEHRQVSLYHLPSHLEVDPEVLVNQNIPCTRDVAPRYCGVRASRYRWRTRTSLSLVCTVESASRRQGSRLARARRFCSQNRNPLPEDSVSHLRRK